MIIREKKRNNNILAIVYMIIIFLNFLLIEPVFKIAALGRIRYFISMAFIIIAILVFCIKKEFKVNKKKWYYFMTNIIPYCIIFFVMVIRSITMEFNMIDQIITFLYWIIPICLMQSAIYLFDEKAIDYTFWAIIVNYFLCIIAYLNLYGFDGIINFFDYVEKGVSPLEIHELTFSIGLIFIYYAFFENKYEKKHKLKVNLCILCIFLGLKRIELLALIVVYVVHVALSLFSEKKRKCLMNWIAIAFIGVSIIYIVVVRLGVLDEFSKKYEINFNSRLEAYKYFEEDYEISMFYEGKGLGYVMNKLELADDSLHGIGDLHNDILKLYIEFGCILWFLYFINFTLLQTNRLKKVYNSEVEELYFLFMVFTYILYLTDNVNRYLIYILVFTMIPYTHFIKLNEVKK